MGNVDRVFGSTNLVGDQSKNIAFITHYGQLEIAEHRADILCRFEYNNSSKDVTITTTGTGTSANSNSMAVASTGAGVGLSRFQSIRTNTYRPAHECKAVMSVTFSAASANTNQRAGIYDSQDGFFFGYSGATFGVTIRKGGSDTFIAQSSWNKDKLNGTGNSQFNIDPTKSNQYLINYGWLGVSPITFMVYGGEDKGWIPCHVYDITNIATSPTILSPSLPISWEAERTSGSGAITVSVGSIFAGRAAAHSHAGHRSFCGKATKTLVAGVETYIATFINNSTFQGKTNKVRIVATFIGCATDGTKSVEFLFRKNATITGASYVAIDSNNSVTSYDVSGSYTGGSLELDIPLAKVDNTSLILDEYIHLELLPGETMTVSGLSAGANDVIIAFRWEEYFA